MNLVKQSGHALNFVYDNPVRSRTSEHLSPEESWGRVRNGSCYPGSGDSLPMHREVWTAARYSCQCPEGRKERRKTWAYRAIV